LERTIAALCELLNGQRALRPRESKLGSQRQSLQKGIRFIAQPAVYNLRR